MADGPATEIPQEAELNPTASSNSFIEQKASSTADRLDSQVGARADAMVLRQKLVQLAGNNPDVNSLVFSPLNSGRTTFRDKLS